MNAIILAPGVLLAHGQTFGMSEYQLARLVISVAFLLLAITGWRLRRRYRR